MLFEDRKKVTKEYLLAKYAPNVDAKAFLKKPSFEVHKTRRKVDRANGNVIKTPPGSMHRSHFMVRDPLSGLEVEIRYAKSHRPTQVGNSLMDVYEPRYVRFDGAKKAFKDDLELGVYMLLHPTSATSKNKTTKPKIEFIDTKARAQEKNDTIDAVTNALSHAQNMKDVELVIFAKGIGLKGVDNMEIEEVRAEVKHYAYKFPKKYNEQRATQITMIEGKILHLVDRGVFQLKTLGTTRRWSWAKGERESETIVDILNAAQDAKTVLKNHIFQKMGEGNWVYVLDTINTELSARENAEKFLKTEEERVVVEVPSYGQPYSTVGNDLPEHLKQVNNDSHIIELPKDKKECLELISTFRNDGKQASWTMAATLMEAIEEQRVTRDDIRFFIKNEFGF